MLQVFVRLPWEQDRSKRLSSVFVDSAENLSWAELFDKLPLKSVLQHVYFTLEGRLLNVNSRVDVKELSSPTFITANARLLGGKGGYGSLLRSQGSRMSSRKSTNFESCRDLEGRRLRTVHQSQAVADYLRREPALKRERRQKTLQKLEKIISSAEASSSHTSLSSEFVAQSQTIVNSVQAAVSHVFQQLPIAVNTEPSSSSNNEFGLRWENLSDLE